MSLSFKAFLYEGSWGGKPVEIRRFNVEQDAATSYVYLLQKLTQVFPTVTTGNVSVAWTDSDGDLVAVSSDDELVEALGHFDGVLFKLYLLKKNSSSSTGTAEPGTAGQPQQEQSGPNRQQRHWGVVCDGCSGPVIGARYKCLVCDDYDLCSACEGRGVHVDHNMITITEPRWGGRGRSCGQWGGRGRRPQGCGAAGPWGRGGFPPFWGMPSPATGNPCGASTGNPCGAGTGNPCGAGTGKKPEPMETDQPTVTEEQKEHIRNIGQFVSNFLQPFGIKVDVDTSAGSKDTQTEEKPASGESGTTPSAVSAEVIEEALTQLRAMGHTDDEGGWLTELVKAKGGNISKVLDALHFTETD